MNKLEVCKKNQCISCNTFDICNLEKMAKYHEHNISAYIIHTYEGDSYQNDIFSKVGLEKEIFKILREVDRYVYMS